MASVGDLVVGYCSSSATERPAAISCRDTFSLGVYSCRDTTRRGRRSASGRAEALSSSVENASRQSSKSPTACRRSNAVSIAGGEGSLRSGMPASRCRWRFSRWRWSWPSGHLLRLEPQEVGQAVVSFFVISAARHHPGEEVLQVLMVRECAADQRVRICLSQYEVRCAAPVEYPHDLLERSQVRRIYRGDR